MRRILNSRSKTSKGVRCFKVSEINFDATDYTDLIYWSDCIITEPPLTKSIKDEALKDMSKEEHFQTFTFDKFPCHTQSVERCVKLITEAATKVCGETWRDGYIRAKIQARRDLPTFDNKGQYYSKA